MVLDHQVVDRAPLLDQLGRDVAEGRVVALGHGQGDRRGEQGVGAVDAHAQLFAQLGVEEHPGLPDKQPEQREQ